MDAILYCLRKNCFIDDDSEDGHGRGHHGRPGHLQVIGRGNGNGDVDVDVDTNIDSMDQFDLNFEASGGGNYEPPTEIPSPSASSDVNADANDDAADSRSDNGEDDDSDRSNSNSLYTTNNRGSRVQNTIFNFFQNIPIGRNSHSHSRLPTEESELESAIANIKQYQLPTKASTFKTTTSGNDNIPTIALSTIVLPGSQLQKKMSLSLKNKIHESSGGGEGNGNVYNDVDSSEDECVICMEGFDSSNPRMPTLCGCGENKTYFHLPCLYHWIEQSSGRDCPSCRKRLTWQEF